MALSINERFGFPVPLYSSYEALTFTSVGLSPLNTSASFLFLDVPELNTHPTYSPVYAAPCTSRCPAQNSGPSGSLVLSRDASSSSAPCRFSPAHCNRDFSPSMKSSALSNEKQNALLPSGWESCQGRPFFGRSSRPLTTLPTRHNRARNEAKRSSVELRSMAEGFVFC